MGIKKMDYFKVLNLHQEPFSNTPDPNFFFKSRQHFGCLQKIELSLRLKRGLNVVIGDAGAGKTMLCRQIVRIFADDNSHETHLILDPQFGSPSDFLNTVVKMFEGALPSEVNDEWQAKERIKQYLYHKGVNENQTVILIIDQGQNIPSFCLEILREFLNYETNEYKLLQIVILARKKFDKTLAAHANFADRINSFHDLGPLNFRDTQKMIQFRLDQAGKSVKAPSFFSFPALWTIFRLGKGNPHKIIDLCRRCLLTMIIQNRNKVGRQLVRSSVRRMDHKKQMKTHRPSIALALAGLFVLALTTKMFPEQLQLPIFWKTQELRLPAVVQKQHLIKNNIKTAYSPQDHQKESANNAPNFSEIDSNNNRSIPGVQLETIRGGFHQNHFRIVFQFTKQIVYEKPIIHANEAVIRLKKVTTNLVPFRQYNTFESWVKLEKNGKDLNVRIGIPEKPLKIDCFEIQNPHRLVINIFTKKPFEQTIS